jgi:heptaprenyl diphosphate synthase
VDSPLDLLEVPGLSDLLQSVDARLVDTAGASDLTSASLRVVKVGGKRLRPALTIATASLGSPFDSQVVAAAAAVELVQVGSLVHDDIFDEALTRRGVPTINAVEGQNEAIFAGTYLLARAAVEAAQAGPAVAADVAHTVAQLCMGQVSESEHIFAIDQEIGHYLATIEGKTAALFACSCRVGGVTAGLPEVDVQNLGEFGRNFGMAFQIIDDVLDLIGHPDLLGKPVGADIRSGVFTMPVLLELADGQGGDLRVLLQRRASIDLDQASRMVRGSSRIEETIEIARKYAKAATDALADVSGSPAALARFPHLYIDWALERFTAA